MTDLTKLQTIEELKPFIYSIELRDIYTEGHSERVGIYAREFVSFLGLNDLVQKVYTAGLLHDLGKIGIPDTVLLKPGKLEKEEFDIIKLHSVLSGKIVEKIPSFKHLADIVRHHHENYDGSGYPDGLEGEKIPFLARVLTLADVFDALTTQRVYRSASNKIEAIEIMKQMQNKFDPNLFDKFLEFIKNFNIIKKEIFEFEDDITKILKSNIFFLDIFTKTLNKQGLLAAFRKSADYELYGSLIKIDIKNFKDYNKLYGIKKGDALLRKFADAIKSTFNAKDSLEEPKEKLAFIARDIADKFYILYLGRRGEFLEYKLKLFSKNIKKIEDISSKYEFILKNKNLKLFKDEIGYLI